MENIIYFEKSWTLGRQRPESVDFVGVQLNSATLILWYAILIRMNFNYILLIYNHRNCMPLLFTIIW